MTIFKKSLVKVALLLWLYNCWEFAWQKMKNREYGMLENLWLYSWMLELAVSGILLRIFTWCNKSCKTKKRLQNKLETLLVVHP